MEPDAVSGLDAVEHVRRALAAHRPVEADVSGARRAAVALLLRPGAHGLELCFIRRAERTGDPWSGHIAFPGGREEAGDSTLEHTALRETLEETGVDVRGTGELLGALDDLAPRSPTLPPVIVRPFVAAVPAGTEVVPNDGEVAGAFWIPLRTLYLPETSRESTVTVRGEPVVVTSFRYDDHVIWGMTERILRQLLGLAGA